MKQAFKTKRSISGGAMTFRKWDMWAIGDVLIGKFKGTHIDGYDKVCPMIEVLDAQFKDGSGDKFMGTTLSLNHNGVVGKAMEKVQEGEIVQFVYNGKTMLEKGKYAGKEAHSVSVDLMELADDDDSSL
jgi:hypothetical protein